MSILQTYSLKAECCLCDYNFDLSWLNKLRYPYVVFSRHSLDIYSEYNIGNEASVYISYILGNYHRIPDYVFFLHAHRTSYHHTGNLDELVNNMPLRDSYRNLNPFGLFKITDNDKVPNFNEVFNKYSSMLSSIIDLKIDIDKVFCKKHAMFYVHRSLIHQYSLKIWKEIYDWMKFVTYDVRHHYQSKSVQDFKVNFLYSGFLFEDLWHVIFTRKLTDKI